MKTRSPQEAGYKIAGVMRLLPIPLFLMTFSLAQEQPKVPQSQAGRKSARKPDSKSSVQTPSFQNPTANKEAADTSKEVAEKIENDRRIADYTKELADYTGKLATYTLILAVVGVVQFLALFVQARALLHHGRLIGQSVAETRRGVEAYRDYVVAVNGSTEALINSERAWVLVDAVGGLLIPNVPERKVPFNQFSFDLRNQGKTVARLGSFTFRCHILPDSESLPTCPDYQGKRLDDEVAPVYGRVLSAGQSNGRIALPIKGRIDEEAFNKIKCGKLRVCAYASLKYFDSFERQRELQFGYTYHPGNDGVAPEWQLIREQEYNKHT